MIKKKYANILTLFVICFTLFYSFSTKYSNSQKLDTISKKEAYKQQKQQNKNKQQKLGKQQPNITKKNTKKSNNKQKTTVKKNNKNSGIKNKKQKKNNDKKTSETKIVISDNIIKSDEIINDIIDKQIDAPRKKRIKVNTKNRGVPSICLPATNNTTPLQKEKQENNLKQYKEHSKEHILSSLIANNINKELADEIYKSLNHIPHTTKIHHRHIKKTFGHFQNVYQIEKRGKVGRKYGKTYSKELQDIEEAFLVDKEATLMIWGMETFYSNSIGSYNAFNALYSAGQNADSMQRLNYFENNLIMLAKLIDNGYFKKDVKSSFDGGLGGCQFMPKSVYDFAVSYNGGKPDIINNNLDVLASIANYLSISGWRFKEGILTEVVLPQDFDICKTGFNTSKTIKEWKQLGVQLHPNGIGRDNTENEEQVVSILITDENDNEQPIADKRAFFVYDNFKVVLTYNRFLNYGITAGLLLEEIKKTIEETNSTKQPSNTK